MRRFIRSEHNAVSAVAKRICGSLDIYGDSSRHPYHSINFTAQLAQASTRLKELDGALADRLSAELENRKGSAISD